jgi:hypothetical protein
MDGLINFMSDKSCAHHSNAMSRFPNDLDVELDPFDSVSQQEIALSSTLDSEEYGASTAIPFGTLSGSDRQGNHVIVVDTKYESNAKACTELAGVFPILFCKIDE